MSIARIIDTSMVPSTISANGHTGDINVSDVENLFANVSVTGGAGTGLTLDVYVDYSDGAGNIIASGVVHFAQFTGTGAGATISNIGPVNGGGGFILTPTIQIRWVLGGTASPQYSGFKVTLRGH